MEDILRVLEEIKNTLSEIGQKRRDSSQELSISSSLIDLEILLNQLSYQLLVERYKGVNVLSPSEYKALEKTALGIKVNKAALGDSPMVNHLANLITQLLYIDPTRADILVSLLKLK